MRGKSIAEIAENTEKNGRKIDKSLCVLRVLGGEFYRHIYSKRWER